MTSTRSRCRTKPGNEMVGEQVFDAWGETVVRGALTMAVYRGMVVGGERTVGVRVGSGGVGQRYGRGVCSCGGRCSIVAKV